MSFCPSCGAERKEGSKFCHNCGHDFSNLADENGNAESNQGPAVQTSNEPISNSQSTRGPFASTEPIHDSSVGTQSTQGPFASTQPNQNPGANVPASKNSHTLAKVLGYVFAILIPLIGIIIGIYLVISKDEEVHKHGIAIIVISIFIWLISFIFMGLSGY